jgi:hypothetical protein
MIITFSLFGALCVATLALAIHTAYEDLSQ